MNQGEKINYLIELNHKREDLSKKVKDIISNPDRTSGKFDKKISTSISERTSFIKLLKEILFKV